jgi:hypothetical protein
MFFRNFFEKVKLGKEITILVFQALRNSSAFLTPIHSYKDIVLRRKTRMDLIKISSFLPLIILPGTVVVLPAIFYMFPGLHPSTLAKVATLFEKRIEVSNNCKVAYTLVDGGMPSTRVDGIRRGLSVSTPVDGLRYLGNKFPNLLPTFRFKRWIKTVTEEDGYVKIDKLDDTEVIECLMERGFYIDFDRDLRQELVGYLEFRKANPMPVFNSINQDASNGSIDNELVEYGLRILKYADAVNSNTGAGHSSNPDAIEKVKSMERLKEQ